MSIFDLLCDIGAAAHDIIDLYFVQSDLKDVHITPAEHSQMAYFDAMASATNSGNEDVPMGKQVW